MKVNVNHPSFISFLNKVSDHILSNISVENYFSLSPEKKLNVQYVVFKLIKNSVKVRAMLTDTEFRGFIVVLWKKNEEIEKYEFASILNDININFDTISEFTKTKTKKTHKVKIETK